MSAPAWPEPGPIDEIVLDTNVLLDWLVFRNPVTRAFDTALNPARLRWVSTEPMRLELGYVLTESLLTRWQVQADNVWATVQQHTCPVEPPAALPPHQRLRCTDTDDQIFIDLAVARRSRWLLTRDRALLKLARRALPHGVTVLTPEAWLRVWSEPAAPEAAGTQPA
ncbi:MAG: putative toxin-antitoxin system toxin component, PIN family [Leptothrix sp. (in: b-proteobacteria)]